MRQSLADALEDEGYQVVAVAGGGEGAVALEQGEFGLVITDVRLPDVSGLAILKKARQIDPAIQVIVITGYGSIEDAVAAMRAGAFDYVTKPFDLEAMLLTVARAVEHHRLTQENIRLRRQVSTYFDTSAIIGDSPPMRRLYALLERVCRTDSTVLLLGESGTGKELVASTIHYQSDRRQGPFVAVNCAALPEGLIESELFGHEKGAFTGANARRAGRFELAHQGTIFLDEIGDVPLPTQVKLLRVLEERAFERVGGGETLEVDVRVVAATNKDLQAEVRAGRFREDLFYRLNVIPIELPPLRERAEDIPLLVDHFTARFNDRFGRRVRFSSGAVAALCRYGFPGNVRELINLVERAVALADGDTVELADLPPHVRGAKERVPLRPLAAVTAEAEQRHIQRILAFTGGNRTQAAKLLGISRKTLWEKMRLHGLEDQGRAETHRTT